MIDTIGNAELKNKEEDLLKNMKMLRHTVADMLGSKSFLRGLAPGAQNGVITVYGEQFPIYITANTLAADGLPEITEDIYDEENYLSLVSDDDLMWYALVEHLAHQAELLQNENNQLREELTAADNEINELEETLREVNKKCSEYVSDIDKLEVDNKRLSERVKTLVIEKTNRSDAAEKVSDPKEKLDMKILRLLEEKLKSTETELTTAMNANSILKTQIAALKDEKRKKENKEENKEFTITINVKKHDDNETDINVYKTEIDKLTREVDHLRKENDKIYSILNDAVKVVRNRNKQ